MHIEILSEKFNLKLFKQQLAYFEDIDFSEPVIYTVDNRPSEIEIKEFLIEISLTKF